MATPIDIGLTVRDSKENDELVVTSECQELRVPRLGLKGSRSLH